jgi:hypothetical protein
VSRRARASDLFGRAERRGREQRGRTRAKVRTRRRKNQPASRVVKQGDCFAKAHISTAETAPRQDTRIPFAHEDQRRAQGACSAPQEGAPSAHPRVALGHWIFRAKRGWHGAASLTLCTARASAAQVPTSPFFFARINCRKAGLDSASRRHWAAQWCGIASGGACAKWCDATAWRYLQDGTSSYIRRVPWRQLRLRH